MFPELIIEFDPPIEWNGGKYDSVELREPTIAQLLKAQTELKGTITPESVTRYQMALIGAVSGKPRQVIEQMAVGKMNEAAAFLDGFVSPKTPETP